jgi:hypothetical protein
MQSAQDETTPTLTFLNYRRFWLTLAVVAVLVLSAAVLFAGVRSQSLSPAVGTLITPPPSASASAAIHVCGKVTAYFVSDIPSGGLIEIDGRNYAIASSASLRPGQRTLPLPSAQVGSDVCLDGTTSDSGALLDFTVTPRTSQSSAAPVFAASECTSATATTRQVIERYFGLSTSNNPQAVTDCFAQSWRDKNQQYAAGTELWSHSGPANSLVVTPVDTVNGCDRFSVTAQMPNNRFWTGGQMFFSVGFEAVNSTQPYGAAQPGRMRIYESGTALLNASNTTLRCG